MFALFARYRQIGALPKRSAFTKFGIDVLVDEALNPHILDVNTRPGMAVYSYRRKNANLAEPWAVNQLYRELSAETVDIAHAVEAMKMGGESLADSARLQDTRSWTLVHNGADPGFAAGEGYLSPGQCYDALAQACVR